MLSLFPDALSYWMFAPLILRMVMAIIFVHWSLVTYKNMYNAPTKSGAVVAIFYGVIGIMFFVGIFTQLAALISIIYFGVRIVQKIVAKQFLTDGINYYLVLFAISLSLFLLGAGYFAFDFGL